ncbi:MAG TPA: M14 family zinc carboxypeptidase [Ignavibacteriaceae bacterium]|nr:M14 family zinc carboxypeptidase [Ignavibacteriaceae bacterium]
MTNDLDFAYRIYYDYQNYLEKSLSNRRIKYSDILPLINQLRSNNIFTISEAGKSAEGRDIFLIKIGKGKTKVFLWTQMHGDESTATMALFDIFNFFASNDSYSTVKDNLFEKLTIYFMPMVNPDGAELFQRRNVFDIDINRDFVMLQTPEAKILKETFDNINAEFGFNLHDQSTLYSTGHSYNTATLSFLAPAFDIEKSVSPAREKSMKIIGNLFNTMSSFIPGHIAKYPDEFEPRAFGDNFQGLGMSTILIESGGWKDDTEKQFIRKLNFISLLIALKSIADESYNHESIETYNSIPFNEKDLLDLILRNLKYKKGGHEYIFDIGIIRTELNGLSSSDYFVKSSIEEIGDLSVLFGYEDLDLDGMEVFPGKTFPKEFSTMEEVEKLDLNKLYLEGYTNIILSDENFSQDISELPINVIKKSQRNINEIQVGNPANLLIQKENQIMYIVLNGFLFDPSKRDGRIRNGIVFR